MGNLLSSQLVGPTFSLWGLQMRIYRGVHSLHGDNAKLRYDTFKCVRILFWQLGGIMQSRVVRASTAYEYIFSQFEGPREVKFGPAVQPDNFLVRLFKCVRIGLFATCREIMQNQVLMPSTAHEDHIWNSQFVGPRFSLWGISNAYVSVFSQLVVRSCKIKFWSLQMRTNLLLHNLYAVGYPVLRLSNAYVSVFGNLYGDHAKSRCDHFKCVRISFLTTCRAKSSCEVFKCVRIGICRTGSGIMQYQVLRPSNACEYPFSQFVGVEPFGIPCALVRPSNAHVSGFSQRHQKTSKPSNGDRRGGCGVAFSCVCTQDSCFLLLHVITTYFS